MASLRVAAEARNCPRTAEVRVSAPGLRTPADRHAQVLGLDHDDDAPRLQVCSTSASAIWVVSRSCTCGRRAKTSTSRASLDRPVICPCAFGM